MTTAETLRTARERYAANPSHAEHAARPEPGTYCMITAIPSIGPREVGSAQEMLRQAAGGVVSLVDFNAAHSTEEVLAVFDKAIAAAEAA